MGDYKVPVLGTSQGEPTKNEIIMFNGTEFVPVPAGTTFTFAIASWTLKSGGVTVGATQEMGIASTEWKAAAALTVQASFTNGNPDATPHCDKTGPGWAADLNLTTSPTFTDAVNSEEATNYPSAVNGTRTFVLHAIQAPDSQITSTITITFRNRRIWGQSTETAMDSDAKIDTFYTTPGTGGGNELSNSIAKTFASSITIEADKYFYYIYRAALGTVTSFIDSLTGFAIDMQSPLTVSWSNPSGFTENVYVYRSTNHSLGAIKPVIT